MARAVIPCKKVKAHVRESKSSSSFFVLVLENRIEDEDELENEEELFI
jgi:hypothetical protein